MRVYNRNERLLNSRRIRHHGLACPLVPIYSKAVRGGRLHIGFVALINPQNCYELNTRLCCQTRHPRDAFPLSSNLQIHLRCHKTNRVRMTESARTQGVTKRTVRTQTQTGPVEICLQNRLGRVGSVHRSARLRDLADFNAHVAVLAHEAIEVGFVQDQ
jgi:hypothetical protein